MSNILEIIVHGCQQPDDKAMAAAVRAADAAAPLAGLVAHGRPVFVRHDSANVDGTQRDVLVYVVRTWPRDQEPQLGYP